MHANGANPEHAAQPTGNSRRQRDHNEGNLKMGPDHVLGLDQIRSHFVMLMVPTDTANGSAPTRSATVPRGLETSSIVSELHDDSGGSYPGCGGAGSVEDSAKNQGTARQPEQPNGAMRQTTMISEGRSRAQDMRRRKRSEHLHPGKGKKMSPVRTIA